MHKELSAIFTLSEAQLKVGKRVQIVMSFPALSNGLQGRVVCVCKAQKGFGVGIEWDTHWIKSPVETKSILVDCRRDKFTKCEYETHLVEL